MIKKENKKTIGSQYADILSRSGIDGTPGVALAECAVLGFRFPDESHAHGFHYDLMEEKAEYLLFSATNNNAIVVTRNADEIRDIAEQGGGVEYKPNLKQ